MLSVPKTKQLPIIVTYGIKQTFRRTPAQFSRSLKLFFLLLTYCLFFTLPLRHTDPLPRSLLHFTFQKRLKTQKPKTIISVYVCMSIQYKHRLTVYLTYPRDLPLVIHSFRQNISLNHPLNHTGYVRDTSRHFYSQPQCTSQL